MRLSTKVLFAGVVLVGFAALTTAVPAARAETLYDVDFGTPPHSVGLPPVVGVGPTPRATVTTIPFGTPTVVAAAGPLTDQPCEFDSWDGQGDQIGLSLSDLPAAGFYAFECDLTVLSLDGNPNATFGILFDTPQVRTIRFGLGVVDVYVPGVFSGTVASYSLGEAVNLRVEISLVGDLWSVYLDDVMVHVGSFGGAGDIVNVRVSSPVTPNPPGAHAAIDNIVLTGSSTIAVEPTSWARLKEQHR